MPVSDSPMVSRASSMEHMHTFGKPATFKKSTFAFSGTGFAFGGARSEYLRKASTTSLTNGDLCAQKVSASGEITRAENGFLDKANHLRSILAENEKSKAEEELSKRKETTKTEITVRNEMDQRELLDAKARSSEILTAQHSLMAKIIEDVKQNLKEAYSKEIKEEVLAQYQRSTRILKEEAKAEYIKQIAPDVKAELRLELRQEAKEEAVVELNEELRSEFIKLKAHLKGEVTSTLRAELSSEVRTELKAIYTDSIKDELRGLYSDQIKDELRQKLMVEVYAEAETDRKLKELAQREKELEAELEDVNERNPSVERDEITEDVNQRNPSVERDEFTEDVNQRNLSVERDEFTEDVNQRNLSVERDVFTEDVNNHNPPVERDEFTDAASQVHTGEPVRDHDLDRSQFSMSPEHSVPESETLRADLPPVTNEPLYPALPRGHNGSLFTWDEEPFSPVINGHALSPIARQAKISTQSPSPAHGTKRSHDYLADSDIGEKHLGSNSKSARHDLTSDHNNQAHDASNDEHFYAKGAVDDPEANHGGEAMSPSGEFGVEGDSHEDGPGDQWEGKPGISSEDYLAIEGDEATGMNEENIYPLDANGAPIYYDDNEEGFGDLGGKKSLVTDDEMPTAHTQGTGSEPGDRGFITNENKQGTNSPFSSPWPRAAKRALDADGYWGSHPKRARDNSRESSLFLTDDEQESRFKHLPTKNVEREASVQNEVTEEVSRSPWRYEQRGEYDDEEVEYSEREEYTSDSDGEDEDEDMDMGRSLPGLDASPDSRADWYHGGPPTVAYTPLDNRGSSLDDAIALDSESEDEEVSVIQETLQPSIEGSPELAAQDSLKFRGANTMEQDAQLKSSIDEDDLLEYDSDEAERP